MSKKSKLSLELTKVCKSYKDGEKSVDVLHDISISMKEGDFFSIQGPSGSGKSTLLSVMGALLKADKGDISVNGKNIDDYFNSGNIHEYRQKHIGIIFQNHYLLTDFTILENVMMPLLIQKQAFNQARKEAIQVLTKVGLKSRMDHFPSQVSGGESQRAAVARAVIHKPALILADEPTGNLDQKNSDNFIKLISGLQKDENLSILVVTHDVDLAKAADRRYNLNDGILKLSE